MKFSQGIKGITPPDTKHYRCTATVRRGIGQKKLLVAVTAHSNEGLLETRQKFVDHLKQSGFRVHLKIDIFEISEATVIEKAEIEASKVEVKQ